jgi:hypothetical protein
VEGSAVAVFEFILIIIGYALAALYVSTALLYAFVRLGQSFGFLRIPGKSGFVKDLLSSFH